MAKFIGSLLGYLVFNLPGAVLGFFIGHMFDQGLSSIDRRGPAAQSTEVQQNFFETLFLLLGMLAKSDGRVSEAEIKGTEQLMSHLGLSAQQRQEAIRYFKQGAQPEFDVDSCMQGFVKVCGRNLRLQQMLLEFLVHIAYSDGMLHAQERVTLEKVAQWLGMQPQQFAQMLAMFEAQFSFAGTNGQAGSGQSPQQKLDKAYKALGVSASATDQEVKRAYRKLMSEHHPDKLIAQGVPEPMIKLANEKSAEISAAYEQIQKARAAA